MRSWSKLVGGVLVALAAAAVPVRAEDRLCDPGNENCRTILINMIRAEQVGIDVGFWFMEDARFSNELIKRHQAGVPIRILVDPRANDTNQYNGQRLAELASAGIPMRKRIASGILHYKMMLFAGQNRLQFSGANYSADAWSFTGDPYTNYTDEAIYYTDDPALVDSFKTKFDDLWTNTTQYASYANITAPLARHYGVFPKHPDLNFPPAESYANRSTGRYNKETQKIDVIMYRITDRRHTDAIIAARSRGIPVRLITEPEQYRDPKRLWHSWNIDRLYMAGVQIKHRAHAGLNHQKSVLLYSQGMTIFGSSNWTSPSDNAQEEHNYFTTKPDIFQWFVDQFERKWNNSAGVIENRDFAPLPPDKPATPAPAAGATGVATPVTLKWYGGLWAHVYDVYLGTDPNNLALVGENLALGPSTTPTTFQQFAVPTTLASGTTYYWRVVAKTMANVTRTSDLWSFTTGGTAAPPPATRTAGPGDVVLYAGEATLKAGAWRSVSDASAAGGVRITHANAGAAKIATAAASPANYFEMTFTAEAGTPYRLWIRGRAELNHYANDSVFVQFSGAVTSSGAAQWRIGTTGAAEVNLEDCGGCGVSGWGWQDNGYGSGVMGPLVYFAASGTQTIRVQTREDGMSIDQILLSRGPYLSAAPGALKNDTTVYAKQNGSGGGGGDTDPPPPPPTNSGDVVLWASEAPTVVGAWSVVADSTAAGGARLRNPNASAAKITTASAAPANYFEMTFNAEAGKPYRLWIRGKADSNHYANDSVFAQFSSAVDAAGAAIYRIGTTQAAEVNLEDCSGCGISGWGWQDNGWGTGVMGPVIYFAATGPQTIRIQQREDGLSIDQIVLSPSTWLSTSPGALKNDTTVIGKQ
jgi:hypothetical protein